MVEEKAKKVEEKVFTLVQVPTQHTLAVATPEGETIAQEELLVRIANTLEELRKSLIGN